MKSHSLAAVAVTVALCALAPLYATEIKVNGTVVLYDDYEAPDVVGMPAVANIGAWAAPGGLVRSATPPSPSQGTQYLAVTSATGPIRHTLTPAASASGTVIRLTTMVYLPTAAQTQNDWYQMVWYNTSGTVGGASNSPIHTSIAGGQLRYYNGTTGYVTTGAPVAYGTWQKWVVEYVVGSGQWTITIDGVTTVMGLNSRSADVGIGNIQFFANGAAGSNAWFFDSALVQNTNDSCSTPFSLVEGTTTGTTAGATNDGSASCGNSNTSPDVWYQFTATCTGQLVLDSCGSGFDTVLSVHTDACPAGAATQLASGCNDDCTGTPCGGTGSCLAVPVVTGTKYLVRVAGKNGATGSFTLHAACTPDCPDLPFPQTFDTTFVGSPACWTGGSRWFNASTGAIVGVTDLDSQSSPHSLLATGTGGDIMIWRDYKGLSSNGTDPINVSFDFKVNHYLQNIAISPFAFNGALWGTAGTPQADAYGWPVNTNFQVDGTLSYIDDVAGAVTLLAGARADLNGQWIRWRGTLYPATRKADVNVEVLTGPLAGMCGGAVGRDFQYSTATDYYGNAMDEIRGSVLFTGSQSVFTSEDQLLIDNYDVRVGPPAALGAPVNDLCANALAVGNGQVYGRTIGATADGSSSCGNSTGSPDVWYKYTASCDGKLLVRTCGSGFDMVVSVHGETCPGTAGTQLAAACNSGCGSGLCPSFQQCLSVPVSAGSKYLVRVAGGNGATGYFGLELLCAAPSPNDACTNATAIGEGTFTGSTLLATNDGDASCGTSASSPDAWFRYTPSRSGLATIDTVGSSFDTVLSVHTNSCPGSFQNELACNDDSGGQQSSISMQVTQGSVYLIRLAGHGGAVGDWTLHVTCEDPCPNKGLPQTFEPDAVGARACWTAGPRFFGYTPGQAVVTDADSRSAPHSLAVTGTGSEVHAWRDYNGMSTNGVRPLTVSFDMKVINFTDHVTITPFVFNHALFGSAGTPHADALGWPVDTKYLAEGSFVYYEDGVQVPILVASRADVNGNWFRYSATLNPATRLTDVTVTILTGPAAGQTGTVSGRQVQYSPATDYYGDAMDELRATGIFTQASFGTGEQILIDNYSLQFGGNCHTPFADADGDGDVDQADFAAFQRCLTASAVTEECACFDTDNGHMGDNDIDTQDFLRFIDCARGPSIPAPADCGN